MREPEAFNLGDEYQAVPIAEGWGDTDWRAGVLLSGGDARGDRPAKSLYPQIFSSEEEALNFARHEVEAQVSQLGRALTPFACLARRRDPVLCRRFTSSRAA